MAKLTGREARLTKDGETDWSDDEFQAWFHEETGHQDVMFRIDLNTGKEVVNMANINHKEDSTKVVCGKWHVSWPSKRRASRNKRKISNHPSE
jgi:hypothetical protein